MPGLQSCPREILDIIIDHLVIIIGPRAVFLRPVSRAFDSSILDALCVRQVIDITDMYYISSAIRGRIAEVKSRSAEAAHLHYLSVIANVNQKLDAMTGETDEELLKQRHEAVAETVYHGISPYRAYDAKWEAQNLLSGAVIIGNLPIVKSILAGRPESSDSLPDVNGATPYFGRPLALAAGWGHVEIVRYLLDSGARSDTICGCHIFQGYSVTAGEDWDPKCGSSLLDAQFEINHPATAPSALRAAVLGGYRHIVRTLLLPEYRISASKVEYLAAIAAAARVDVDLIQIMFEAIGKSLSDYPWLGLKMMLNAVEYDRKDVVQMILDKGVVYVNTAAWGSISVPMYGTALQVAARMGNTKMMRFLLERGACVSLDVKPKWALQPIESAARCGQVEAVELLLDLGADPATALGHAADNGQIRVVKLLLDRYPDLVRSEGGDVGRLALLRALSIRNLAVVTLLAQRGVSFIERFQHGLGYYNRSLTDVIEERTWGTWVRKHLISLGVEITDCDGHEDLYPPRLRGIKVRECTWQWAGRY
ncbi:hypothetical protein QQS21_012940 [Conoideocrella luteorostrata]|uniref:Ankyrin n=1 Tax=Conoideocrella luteorostrata TaxID=1105319 RepID=A0AAJ0CD30_9HYPO|nr:hypothetical protein QQS21_012940 [Conoideocrella luteorostrata]